MKNKNNFIFLHLFYDLNSLQFFNDDRIVIYNYFPKREVITL